MNIKIHWIAALLALLSVAIVGCAPAAYAADPPTAEPVELDGSSWLLSHMHGQPVTSNTEVTLIFEDGKAHGNAACNGFSGPYERDGERLSFGLLISTMMACPDMDLETGYLAALASTATYQATADQLVLFDEDGASVLVFAPRRDVPLGGTVWQLTGLNTGSAFTTPLGDSAISATFVEDRVGGSAGCNTYFASVTIEDGTLSTGPIGSTEMYCIAPAGLMEQERSYLDALASATAFAIDGDALTLSDADGVRLLTFVATEG